MGGTGSDSDEFTTTDTSSDEALKKQKEKDHDHDHETQKRCHCGSKKKEHDGKKKNARKHSCKRPLIPLKAELAESAKALDIALKHITAALALLGVHESPNGETIDLRPQKECHLNNQVLQLLVNLSRASDDVDDAQREVSIGQTRLKTLLHKCGPLDECDIPQILRLDKNVDDANAKALGAEEFLHSAYFDLCGLNACDPKQRKLWQAVLKEVRLADDVLPITLSGRHNREAIGCITGCILVDNTPD